MPLYEAGLQVEPPVWEPNAAAHICVATATEEPLLEPPGVWAGSHGFRVGEGSPVANSVVTALPKTIPPASFMRATQVAS